MRAVYTRDRDFPGPFASEAPDLQVGFADGYRVSWESWYGGVAAEVFEDNRSRWSGDRAGYDAAASPGVLLSTRRVVAQNPDIVDLAATVLRFFDVDPPEDLEGSPLY